MTDLHCHIVYGVDDGAQTFEESCNMLRAAYEDKVNTLVCTSHISPGQDYFPDDLYRNHLKEEIDWLEAQNIPLTLLPGHEIFYTDHTPRLLRQGEVNRLGDSSYVLVEFSPETPFERIEEAIQKLTVSGYRVLVAHFERYQCLRNISRVKDLRNRFGCRMQMNAHTVIVKPSFFTGRWIKHVYDEHLVDAIASDAHGTSSRRTHMTAAYEALSQRYGEDTAHLLLIDNPEKYLHE